MSERWPNKCYYQKYNQEELFRYMSIFVGNNSSFALFLRSILTVHLSEASSSSEYESNDKSAESAKLYVVSERAELPSSPKKQRSQKEALRNCALKHVNHITHNFLYGHLGILKSEGHTDLPKTAETLLRTQRTKGRIRPTLSKKGTYGTYMGHSTEHLQLKNFFT